MVKPLIALLLGLVICKQSITQYLNAKDIQKVTFREFKSLEKDGWEKNGTFIINVNQGALRNWAGGGELNTLGLTTLFNYKINHRKGRITWNNYLDLGVGFQHASSFGKFRKVDDRIDITSKYAYQFAQKWYSAILANVNTQSLIGYSYTDSTDTKISNFLTPGKILLSVGIDFRPDKTFTLFVSPITTRFILKNDKDFYTIDKFGVTANNQIQTELGSLATAKYTKKISTWAFYSGRLDLFSNYNQQPENVDVFFTNLLTMKFNKWLATNVSFDLVYDDDILKKTQIKEVLGLGLTVKL